MIIILSVIVQVWVFFYFFRGETFPDEIFLEVFAGIGIVSGLVGGFFVPKEIKRASIYSSVTIMILSAVPFFLFGGTILDVLNDSNSFGAFIVSIILLSAVIAIFIIGVSIAAFILLGGLIGKTISPFK